MFVPELRESIEDARARLGDGPYLIIEHARSLDIDGIMDSLSLVSGHADLAEARIALDRAFRRTCEALLDDKSWHDEAPHAVELTPGHGVTLVEQRAIKRKDATGFNAETRIVQLLEIAPPPLVGEPLFRALGYR